MRSRIKSYLALRHLPPRAAWFYLRARRLAARSDDEFSLASVARPYELGQLIRLARGRRRVVEIGTGTAWTTIALALDEPQRRVATYDPIARPERELYLALVPASVRARIEFVEGFGEAGQRHEGPPAELLFLDSSHGKQETLESFAAWQPALARGAVVAFHDYGSDIYPGVTEAIRELGLEGEVRGPLFVWHKP